MFSHVTVLVAEQALRMPEVSGVAGSLGTDVVKLEVHACRLARLAVVRGPPPWGSLWSPSGRT